MGIAKWIHNGIEKFNLKNDTATPDVVVKGFSFHDNNGDIKTGTMEYFMGYELSEDLMPTAIDTDGSIYNGCGYMDGKRLSSSGSLSNLATARVTGFIPYGYDEDYVVDGHGERIYLNYVVYYDENFNKLLALGDNGSDPRTGGYQYCRTTHSVVQKQTKNDSTKNIF